MLSWRYQMYFPSAVPTKLKFKLLLFDICLEHVVKMRTSHVRLCKQCSALAVARRTYQAVCMILFSVLPETSWVVSIGNIVNVLLFPCSSFWSGFDQWRGSSVHGISFESCTCRTVTLQRYGGLGVRMYLKDFKGPWCCVTIYILLMIWLWFPYLWWYLNHIFN